MKYKLIAVDFDGTLLTDNKILPERNKQILRKFQEFGYKIVGVTARALESVKSICDIKLFDYLILNNGSFVYNVKEQIGIYESIIEMEDAKAITKEYEEECTQIDYCSATSYYCYKSKHKSKINFVKNIESLEEVTEKIARMNLFLKVQDNIDKIHTKIIQKYKQINCFVMQNSKADTRWLVINPKGLNKAVTLKKLGNKLKIGLDEMIFFGDGLNDLEVIEEVGLGVAMGNALEEVKQRSKAVTLTNEAEGVAVFLERFLKEEG